MMQEEYNEFDSLVKSMLEDAEVAPPRSVWKSVSSHIGVSTSEDDAHRKYGAVWGYACMAMAVASVAAGVFLFRRSSEPAVGVIASPAEYHAEVEMVEESEDNASAAMDDYVKGGLMPNNAPVGTMLASAESFVEVVADERQETSTSEVEKIYDASVQSASESESHVGRTTRKVQRDDHDPFDVLEEAEGKSFWDKPVALYTKGAVGGNDSDMSFNRVHQSFAPGVVGDGIVETGSSVYGIPLSFGIGIRKSIAPRVSLGIGVDYTRLSRTFAGKYVHNGQTVEAGTVSHILQYVGVPLEIYYNVIGSDRLKFYLHAGGEAEYCLSSRYTLFAAPDITVSDVVRKLQYSVGAGVGVEFAVASQFGVYIDPGIRYYFPCMQPKSVRTEHPLLANFDVGLRFSF